MGLNDSELSLLFTGDEGAGGIRELNRRYRSKDTPTDVLSFPMDDDEVMLGDVVVSVETAARQADEFSVLIEDELMRLLVHGVLHLVGYDHVRGGRQAAKMKRREEKLLEAIRASGVV